MTDVESRCSCPGATVWLTGPSAADRLAVASLLAERLLEERRRVEVLDRFDDLGGDARGLGVMTEVLARNGVVAIVPCAGGDATSVRARHEASHTHYVEVSTAGQDGPEQTAVAVYELLVGRSRSTLGPAAHTPRTL